ncbi:MAG: NAD-dependent epimerase/dehydratase family protein [Marinicella sp.]
MTDSKNPPIIRRDFLKTGIKLSLGIPLLSTHLSALASATQNIQNAAKKLRILILGGTSFLGPHQIAYALARGHSISTFTRGKTKATVHQDVFEHVEELIGDRNNDHSALENKQWDVVIDNSGRNTEWTSKSAELLKDQAGLYIYVSSVSVYFPFLTAGADENSRVLLQDPGADQDKNAETQDSYGVMKAKSEQAAIKAFTAERALIVRPTFIIGPGDLTDRFIHWPVRLAKGGETLIPGKPEDQVQYIDVRDLAEWMITMAENNTSGTFNAVGPKIKQSMAEFIKEASSSFQVPTQFTYVDDQDFLAKNQIYGVVPWVLPDGDYFGISKASNTKAMQSGLAFRSLSSTVKDTYLWWYSDALNQERRNQFELKAGSLLVNEKTLLKNWHNT